MMSIKTYNPSEDIRCSEELHDFSESRKYLLWGISPTGDSEKTYDFSFKNKTDV